MSLKNLHTVKDVWNLKYLFILHQRVDGNMIKSFANTSAGRFTLHHVLSVTNREEKWPYFILQPMLFISMCLCVHYSLKLKILMTCLGTSVTALSSQLVDLGLCNISSLFSLIQLMLQFAELSKIGISLFLLKNKKREWQRRNMANTKILLISLSD